MADDTSTSTPSANTSSAETPSKPAAGATGRKRGPVAKPAASKSSARKAPARTTVASSAAVKKTTGSNARKPAAKRAAPVTRAAKAATAAVAGAATSLAEPVTEAIAPVAKAVTSTARSAAKTGAKAVRTTRSTAKRESAAVRTRVKKAVRATRTAARDATDTASAAVTGRTAKTFGVAAAGLLTGLAINVGRKILVQAPSTLAGDWFAAIKAEHKLALGLFDKLQATDNSQTAQRTALLAQLKHALGKHAFTEENVIYPALRAWGDKADADKLNHDHGYVKQYLYELEGTDKASSSFLTQVADFRAALEAHIREEEDAILPPLHKALGKAGNAKVTAQANKEGFKLA